MRYSNSKRVLAVVLTLCLMLSLIPVFGTVEVEAVSGLSSLTCADYISNGIARNYIDTMMRYYINNNSTLQSTLNNGQCVIFMFEGGSDNYWNGETYENSLYDNRIQAVVFVVKLDSSGNAYIDFCSETCSSIATTPNSCTAGVGNSGSTTILDGIYRVYKWNHTGPYASFQLDVAAFNGGYGLYVPTSVPNGQILGCSGINVHTRSTTSGSNWSAGCQLIGTGAYTSNEYNKFFRSVTGFSFDPWTDYYNGGLYSYGYYGWGCGYNYTVGYYVVDRQLAMIGIDGAKYGTGSLNNVFNTTALGKLTAYSTPLAQAAGALDYATSQCSYYPSYCKIEATLDGAPINTQPCSVSTTNGSSTIQTVTAGQTFTATGLFKNEYGNYWYRIKLDSGKTGYIYGGECKYLEEYHDDIKLTGAEPPNGHNVGGTWYVNGTISTQYSGLSSVSCYVYSGFGSDTEAVTGTSDTPVASPSGINYVLKGSTVDDKTWMGALAVGNYTYVLSAAYQNYYATSATEIASNSGTLTLMDEYFAVVETTTDQSTCSHNNTTHVLEETTCTTTGETVTVCSICGKLTVDNVAGSHSYGDWVTTTQPTCTATGVSTKTCALCGDRQTQSIPATGHSYSTVVHPATCLEYERYEYTCGACGHNYSAYADELMTQWMETKPEGVDESLIETKTQYRYSDYETVTSGSAAMDGYTLLSKEWIKSGTGYDHYVKSWDSGYDTTHSLYSQYTRSILGTVETDTSKREYSTTETLVGYIYYHWCRGTYTAGPINRTTSKTEDSTYTTFHSFVASISTIDPSTLTTASDGSVTYSNAGCCTDTWWWYYIPVYEQTYTDYTAQYTYERWTDYTDWSDEVATASDTRKVETRTLYRYVDAQLGNHSWVDGVCTTCKEACAHETYSGGYCTVCGVAEPIKDYYLFGYINGANYACEEDYENLGEYLFVDGKLTVKFESDSYVAVKSGDNWNWYMTDGWLGYNATSATLYKTGTVANSDKLYVPGGVEVVFTLTINDDGTLFLSYEAEQLIQPTVTITSASLAFEDEIYYNLYFDAANLDHVVEMGLVTFHEKLSDGTIDNAVDVIPGYETLDGEYMVRSNGVPAKNMGDVLYFKVYAKLANGTYVYSNIVGYHAGMYAKSMLKNSNNVKMKALCVAMVNYGAQAQLYFNYNTDNLVNAFLTDAQKTFVADYNETMIDDLVAPSSTKTARFVKSGFDGRSAAVEFSGAFSINYYFTPTYAPDGEMRLYYWDVDTFNSVSQLTMSNATGSVVTTKIEGSNEYTGSVTGIAAKHLDRAYYVAGVYTSDGVTYTTGVITYSIGAYCQGKAAGTTTVKDLAAATGVYCYYAKAYFGLV